MLKLRVLKIFSYVMLLKILNAFISLCFRHFPEMATRSQVRENTCTISSDYSKKKKKQIFAVRQK